LSQGWIADYYSFGGFHAECSCDGSGGIAFLRAVIRRRVGEAFRRAVRQPRDVGQDCIGLDRFGIVGKKEGAIPSGSVRVKTGKFLFMR